MMVGRGAKKRGVRYFGPYSHAWAIRETVDLLLRVFPMRSCSNGVFKRSEQIGRPCLLGYIGKCSAPCVGRVERRGAPRHRRRLLRLHGRPDHRLRQAPGEGDVRRLRPPRTTSGRPGCATTSAPSTARWRSSRWCSATARTPTWSRCPRTRSRSRCRSSTCAAAGSAASAAGWPTRSTTPTPPAWSSASSSSCTTGSSATRSRARCWSPRCPRTPRPSRTGSATCAAGRGCRSRCRSAATRRPCRRPSAATRSRRSACTRPSGPAT